MILSILSNCEDYLNDPVLDVIGIQFLRSGLYAVSQS
jgi:hypothetical protein